MIELYWNPSAVNYLILLLLTLMNSAFFISQLVRNFKMKREFHISLALSVLFTSIFLLSAARLLIVITKHDIGNYALLFASTIGFVCIISFLYFTYFLGRPNKPISWPAYVFAMAMTAQLLFEIWVSYERAKLLAIGVVEFREAWADIPVAAGFLFSFLFLFVNLLRGFASKYKCHIVVAAGNALRSLLFPWKPLSHDLASIRAFLYVSLWPLVLGVASLLRSYGVLTWAETEIIAVWSVSIACVGFSIVYLNYIPENSSFNLKLVGITTATILLILGGISWLIGTVYVETYSNPNHPRDNTTVRYTVGPDNAYTVTDVRHGFDSKLGALVATLDRPIELPFAFPFYGEKQSELYIHEGGMIGFERPPRWRDVQFKYGPQPTIFVLAANIFAPIPESLDNTKSQAGLFLKHEESHSTLTWNRFISASAPHEEYTFQIRLYKDGAIEMAYEDVPDFLVPEIYTAYKTPMMRGIVPDYAGRSVREIQMEFDLPVTGAEGVGLMAQHRYEFLRYLNRVFEPTAYYILLLSLIHI